MLKGNNSTTTVVVTADAMVTTNKMVNSKLASISALVNFGPNNGEDPGSYLLSDSGGDLWGTTEAGGANYNGTLFEIPYNSGHYSGTQITVSSFGAGAYAAGGPSSGLIADQAGNLLGATQAGGAKGDGAVYESLTAISRTRRI
jgi:uncharacterized repeat protein (TIGR03803 family)